MISVVSTPEMVARAYAQAQVEAVILHTHLSTITFYSQNKKMELADSPNYQNQNGVAYGSLEQENGFCALACL
jgi:transcription initiation factor TFIID subunit TAF12